MGKGDRRSRRGKIFRGSYGKTRLRKQKSSQKSAYADGKSEKKHFEKKEKPSQVKEVPSLQREEKKIKQVTLEVQVQEEIKTELPLETASNFQEKPPEITGLEIATPEIVEEVPPEIQSAEPEQQAEEIIPEEIKSEDKQVEAEMTSVIPEVRNEPVIETESSVKTDEILPQTAGESAAVDQTKEEIAVKKEPKTVKAKREKKKTNESKTTSTKRGRPKKKKD